MDRGTCNNEKRKIIRKYQEAAAFYTDSKKLKDVVLDPKRKYPFRAVIKVVRYGTMYGFKFFPPNTPITQEDRDNFEYYKRNKYKKNR